MDEGEAEIFESFNFFKEFVWEVDGMISQIVPTKVTLLHMY